LLHEKVITNLLCGSRVVFGCVVLHPLCGAWICGWACSGRGSATQTKL